jgi:hypothetical protein
MSRSGQVTVALIRKSRQVLGDPKTVANRCGSCLIRRLLLSAKKSFIQNLENGKGSTNGMSFLATRVLINYDRPKSGGQFHKCTTA